MFPSFVIRAFMLAFGYVYPAYQSFKALQRRRRDVKELTFWCRYWVLLAIAATIEYFADPLLSWVPMYPESKLALVIFLWHPATLGTDYVYDQFLIPLLVRHEAVIDKRLKDASDQAQEVAAQLWRQACMHAQVQFMEVLNYLSAMSVEAARQANMHRSQNTRPEVQEVDADSTDYTFVDRPRERHAGKAVLQEVEDESLSDTEDLPLSTLVSQHQDPTPVRRSSRTQPADASSSHEEGAESSTPGGIMSRLRTRRRVAAAR